MRFEFPSFFWVLHDPVSDNNSSVDQYKFLISR